MQNMAGSNKTFFKVWKELFSTASNGPLATIPYISHAAPLHPRSQLLQGFESDNRHITSFACQLCEGGGEIDNPDQRLTADVNSMLTSYERLMEDDLFILPAATAYYAYKVLAKLFVDPKDPPMQAYCASTWIGPTGMFGLFLLSFLNKFLMNPVAKRTAKLEER